VKNFNIKCQKAFTLQCGSEGCPKAWLRWTFSAVSASPKTRRELPRPQRCDSPRRARELLPRRQRPPPRWRPLTPTLPLPAGVAMARPPLPPPAGVCLHRAGGAGAPAPGETGTQPTAARPPSIPAGWCSGRRGMKVMCWRLPAGRGGRVPAAGVGWAAAAPGGLRGWWWRWGVCVR